LTVHTKSPSALVEGVIGKAFDFRLESTSELQAFPKPCGWSMWDGRIANGVSTALRRSEQAQFSGETRASRRTTDREGGLHLGMGASAASLMRLLPGFLTKPSGFSRRHQSMNSRIPNIGNQRSEP
jgi:hypothetical protein